MGCCSCTAWEDEEKGMGSYIEQGMKYVFPGKCFEELIINFNFTHKTCPKLVLSRLLGLGITAGSLFLFVPQILKIFAAKSAKGISLVSQLLALLGAAATTAYSYKKGFVFSQWGDSLFVTMQLIVIIMQVLHYSSSSAYAFAFFSLCWASLFAVMGDFIPMTVLTALQAAGIPIVVVSKGIQIWQNYRSQSTGQLSLISVFLQFAGTVARVFTSVQETGDTLLIGGFGVAAVLNAVLFGQFFIYWSTVPEKVKKQ